LDEEYITMGMAGWGEPTCLDLMQKFVVDDEKNITLMHNFHLGIDDAEFLGYSNQDIAYAAQRVATRLINQVKRKASELSRSSNLVYMGGVALNCSANASMSGLFSETWIMPNPGDAGSSLGAAALVYGKKLHWDNAFLGYNIDGEYPVDEIIDELFSNRIVGVANGRAEFGPRALGNRSLLADPRGSDIKDKVNEIKRRQKFRPFAPVILEEFVDEYFNMPISWNKSPYMQVVAECFKPDEYPAIVHVDGTSRVQTVPRDGSGIRRLLERWYDETGCPMLLNTSLNIRGEPMVNDVSDAIRFELEYGVKVFS
jgi:carbamoyltransferase